MPRRGGRSITNTISLGLCICVILCVLSLLRQSSLTMLAVTHYKYALNWEEDAATAVVEITSSAEATTITTDDAASDAAAAAAAVATTTSTRLRERPSVAAVVGHTNASPTNRHPEVDAPHLTYAREYSDHHPRMVSLSDRMLLLVPSTTPGVDNRMYVVEETPLLLMKYSSAVHSYQRSIQSKRNKTNTNENSIIVPLERHYHHNYFVLNEIRTIQEEEEEEEKEIEKVPPRYRDFERDWFQKCVPIINGSDDDDDVDVDRNNNNSSTTNNGETTDTNTHTNTPNENPLAADWDASDTTTTAEHPDVGRRRRIATIRPTCTVFHEIDMITEDDDSTQLLSMKGSWRSVFTKRKRTMTMIDTNNTNNNANTHPLLPTTPPVGVVLKLLHTHRQFNEESYTIHQLDALVMEAVSASPYVVSMYGFCGQSVMTEEAMSLGQLYVKHPKHGWLDRLRIARNIARGLADLHALTPHQYNTDDENDDNHHNTDPSTGFLNTDNSTTITSSSSSSSSSSSLFGASFNYSDNISSIFHQKQQQYNTGKQQQRQHTMPLLFAHHDINFANLIAVQPGRIQWNDFNLGIISRWYDDDVDNQSDSVANSNDRNGNIRMIIGESHRNNNTRGTDNNNTNAITRRRCPVPIRYASPLWRSPEEILNRTGYFNLRNGATPQAADVFSLGNILFQVLTRHQPWTHLEEAMNGTTSATLSAVATAKVKGRLPNLPERYVTRNEAKLLWRIIQQCFRFDPNERPTAYDVAEYIGKAYNHYKAKKKKVRSNERGRGEQKPQ